MKSQRNFSFPWLDNLLSYFLNIKEIDDEIELIRVSLCEISQFSPVSLFEYLDIDLKSFLTLNDFKSFLISQKSTYDEQKLRKMIHNFDKDSDFSLNLKEFIGLIVPKKNEVLKQNIFSRVNTYSKRNNNITEEMKSNLNDLILSEMKLIKESNEISTKIKNSKIFSSYEAFLSIVGDENYMTQSNLYRFLKNNGVDFNENEVAQLMFRLDSDNDDRISYEEFKEIFYPIKEDFVYIQKNNIFYEKDKYDNNKKYIYNNDNNYNKKYNENYIDKYNDNNEYDNNNDENNNDYNNNENDDDISNETKEKKGKKTKKVILKPGKNSNLLHSQGPINNELMNNPQETSYTKYPNINNNNSTDNYILKNKTAKYNNYTFSKTYENTNPALNEDNNENNNENNYNSKITQESLIINNNKLNKYQYTSKRYKDIPSNINNYDIEDSKYPNYDNNEINNYENNSILSSRNRKYFSPNNYNEANHNHNTVNCKGCLYSAKNIYNNYKTRKNNNISNNIDNENYNINSKKKRDDYKLKNGERNDINNKSALNDYYRIKDKLLRKYGNVNNDENKNSRNNYFYSSEEDISSRKNRYFSSPREALLDNNDNNYEKNIDNFDDKIKKYDNISKNEEEIGPSQINTSKKIEKNRYITNSKSNIYPSPSSIYNDSNVKKNTFAERYNRIKENKLPKGGCKNCSSSPKFSQLKNINIKENNIKDKKDLLYKLFIDFIEQDIKLENIKESLSKCQGDSLPKIFELFNRSNKDKIYSSDFYEVLNSLSHTGNFKPNEIKFIFKKYNKSTESGFNYDEFVKIILPRKISSKITMENRKTNINNEFENDTNDKVFELFTTLIEGEKSNEEIRSMICMAADNIFYDLFGEIKKENKPGIQKDDIDKFMKENGYDIKNYEIEIIMEKMDKNRDYIIDYEEFISEIQPKII